MNKIRTVLYLVALILLHRSIASAAWVNDKAPNFSLQTLNGTKVTLAEHQGEVVIVNFWASWCPPCKQEFPQINQLAADQAGKKVKVIAITVDKALANINKFFSKNGQPSPELSLVRDPDGKIAGGYGARAMPVTYVIDPKGTIRFVHLGYQNGDPQKWRKEIEGLLTETSSTKE